MFGVGEWVEVGRRGGRRSRGLQVYRGDLDITCD